MNMVVEFLSISQEVGVRRGVLSVRVIVVGVRSMVMGLGVNWSRLSWRTCLLQFKE